MSEDALIVASLLKGDTKTPECTFYNVIVQTIGDNTYVAALTPDKDWVPERDQLYTMHFYQDMYVIYDSTIKQGDVKTIIFKVVNLEEHELSIRKY